jgi:hypothetical protein
MRRASSGSGAAAKPPEAYVVVMPPKEKVRAEVEILFPAVARDVWGVRYTEASPQFIIFAPRFYFLNTETRHRKVERRCQVCPKKRSR